MLRFGFFAGFRSFTGRERLRYTLAIHEGRSNEPEKPPNPHAHLIWSDRGHDGIERTASTWFKRYNGKLRDELLNGEIFYSLAQAAVLVEQWRREYNTVRPHSACGGFPPAPEAIKPSPWFLRMPVLHGPPQVLGLT